ncbi:peptidoglycan-binding protein [Oculatella sp. LEGE 06141]|nr:peptidoglycan-binding protein [Oculatella sp. LEGE 06141]
MVVAGQELCPWDTGAAVIELQELLNAHGFTLRLDGDFGSRTETAVRLYQRQHHIKVDGIVGAKTWAALRTTVQAGTRTLRQGYTGADVYELQGLLKVHGYNVQRNGIFNEETHQAIATFQHKYHLTPTGIVNPTTWTALRERSLPTPPKQSFWYFNLGRWW